MDHDIQKVRWINNIEQRGLADEKGQSQEIRLKKRH